MILIHVWLLIFGGRCQFMLCLLVLVLLLVLLRQRHQFAKQAVQSRLRRRLGKGRGRVARLLRGARTLRRELDARALGDGGGHPLE